MKVTLDDEVIFKPNELGHSLYETHRLAAGLMGMPTPPMVVDADGYATMPLWEFMQVFGPSLYLGSKSPFSGPTIEIRGR